MHFPFQAAIEWVENRVVWMRDPAEELSHRIGTLDRRWVQIDAQFPFIKTIGVIALASFAAGALYYGISFVPILISAPFLFGIAAIHFLAMHKLVFDKRNPSSLMYLFHNKICCQESFEVCARRFTQAEQNHLYQEVEKALYIAYAVLSIWKTPIEANVVMVPLSAIIHYVGQQKLKERYPG